MEQTNEICPYPNCHLDVDHDGDHDFKRPAKPRGPLRTVQTFNAHFNQGGWRIRCEISAGHGFAAGLYQDEFGYGWELCEDCATKGGAVHELPGPRPVDKAVSSVSESAPNNRRTNG